MFTVRASHSEKVEINAEFEKVRDFFTNIQNFIELMPSIESIHTDGKGIAHWKIRADIPFIGSFIEKFSVREIEDSDELVEWIPALDEKYNLMKYAAEFLPKKRNLTLVQFSQTIEMRRNSATVLHLLAGLAGESIISREMTKRVADMLKTFIIQARNQIES